MSIPGELRALNERAWDGEKGTMGFLKLSLSTLAVAVLPVTGHVDHFSICHRSLRRR